MKTTLSIILALVAGEISLILLATIAQEVLFDGIRYLTSSKIELLLGGFATFVAAIISGLIARVVMKDLKPVVPLGISLLIVTETTYLIASNKTGDPWWADAVAGLCLVIGIWIGFYWKEFIYIASNENIKA